MLRDEGDSVHGDKLGVCSGGGAGDPLLTPLHLHPAWKKATVPTAPSFAIVGVSTVPLGGPLRLLGQDLSCDRDWTWVLATGGDRSLEPQSGAARG